MPLIKKKSHKSQPAPKDDLPPKKKSIAIALNMQGLKKSAKNKSQETDNDKGEVSRNSGDKAPKNDSVKDHPTELQANPKDRKKLDDGGEVDNDEVKVEVDKPKRSPEEIMKSMEEHQKALDEHKAELEEANKYAAGGEIEANEHMEKPKSVADAIRKRQKSEDPGVIDLDSDESDADTLEPLNEKAADESVYDDDQLDDQPEDSNEHMDNLISDTHDMLSRIRAQMKAKRKS